MTTLAVNGRYRTLEPGGYRTYAGEIVTRLSDPRVVAPPGWTARGVRGRLWEQAALPLTVGRSVLFNPCNSGPLMCLGPQINVVHDLAPLERPDLFARRYVRAARPSIAGFVRAATVVVTPSRAVAESVERVFGVDPAALRVVPPGLPDHQTSPDSDQQLIHLGIAPDRPLVVGLSSTVPRKNGRAVIDVLGAIVAEDPALQVVAVGFDGPHRVFGAGEHRPRRDDVLDLGAVDEPTLRSLYARADVVLALPYLEGFGMSQVEALAAGASVVTSPVPSVAEHCPTACTLVTPDDHDGACHAVMAALAERPETRPSPEFRDLDWNLAARRIEQIAAGLR